jgi:mannosyl-oligosaccharide glucosidase
MLIGNMLGGLGYFHGTSLVDRALEGLETDVPVDFLEDIQQAAVVDEFFSTDVDDEPEKREPKPQFEGPTSLFTGVPSRPFFPRGFLWDSGFDQHLLGAWDNDLSLDIMSHWAALIDDDGWVAREQILGDEARSKVPKEFQVQYTHFANPPTLITGLSRYLARIENSPVGIRICG